MSETQQAQVYRFKKVVRDPETPKWSLERNVYALEAYLDDNNIEKIEIQLTYYASWGGYVRRTINITYSDLENTDLKIEVSQIRDNYSGTGLDYHVVFYAAIAGEEIYPLSELANALLDNEINDDNVDKYVVKFLEDLKEAIEISLDEYIPTPDP